MCSESRRKMTTQKAERSNGRGSNSSVIPSPRSGYPNALPQSVPCRPAAGIQAIVRVLCCFFRLDGVKRWEERSDEKATKDQTELVVMGVYFLFSDEMIEFLSRDIHD
jgi:hypothetical protein